MDLKTITGSLWDQGGHFFRKLINIFDMQHLEYKDIPQMLKVIDGLRFLFEDKASEVRELGKDVKILILNAEQKKFCEELKISMEKETWTAIKFGRDYNYKIVFIHQTFYTINQLKEEDHKHDLRDALKVYKNIQIYSENIVVEGLKYMLTSSCRLLVGHLLQLKKLEAQLQDISSEFTAKMVDVIKVRLTSSSSSTPKNS